MAPTPSSILSTHSGHHRIFIGPVVQKSTTTTGNGTASTFSTSHHPRRKGQAVRTHTNHHHRNNVAPKPWWDQGSYLRSHLSLHSITQPGSGDAPSVPATTGGNAGGGGAASNTSSKQSSIPQLSYTFSDDSSTDESIDTQDEVIGEDDTDDEEDKEKERHVYHDHTAASSSSESLSAPVGHDEPPPSNNDSSESRGIGVGGIGASGKTKMIGKGKQRAIEDEDHQGVELDTFHFNDNTNEQYQLNQSDKSAAGAADPGISSTLASGLGRLRTKAKKKRSKSLRDEGEPTGLRKFFGQYREGRHHQGQLDNPDLGWESDDQGYGGSSRPRTTRHATSGALTNVQPTQQPHDGYRSVLVSSPMSSNIDLPGAHQGPVFVSSPMSSALDVNETNLERPEPTPIQKLSPDSANSDHLGPGWKPSPSTTSLSSPPLSPTSPSSPTSPTSPLNDKPQRVATWMTARETISSTGRESLHGQAIKEEDEEDEEDEDGEEDDDEGGVAVGRSEDDDNDDNGASDLDDDDDVDDADEHYSLAKVISRESRDGAGVQNNGRGGKGQGQGARRTDQEATNEMTTSRMTPRTTTTITNEKEPLSSTLSKAGTRFGRALLDRAPTGLKRQNGMPLKNTPQQRESMCSVDKDCHGSIDHHLDASTMPSSAKPKKHVRFLTKVQTQIASGRQPTLLTTHPVIKQDRMLVRKEVTERPGPHVFNSDTARRLERLSQGWREWWCVMKGAPAGNQQPEPVTKIRKKSKAANRVEKGRLEFYYNHWAISAL
ncbi:hypothetical protein B0O80DRAFT_234450 [Mortierella sp. GBAus27b]|nr:hypothetical protein B0O80DRAFT_234450 [Mortierella sp. GBAus27b]